MRRIAPVVLLLLLWVPAAGAWTWPVNGPVLQGFAFDPAHPYAGGQHRGVDVGADAAGLPVRRARGRRRHLRGDGAVEREVADDRDARRAGGDADPSRLGLGRQGGRRRRGSGRRHGRAERDAGGGRAVPPRRHPDGRGSRGLPRPAFVPAGLGARPSLLRRPLRRRRRSAAAPPVAADPPAAAPPVDPAPSATDPAPAAVQPAPDAPPAPDAAPAADAPAAQPSPFAPSEPAAPPAAGTAPAAEPPAAQPQPAAAPTEPRLRRPSPQLRRPRPRSCAASSRRSARRAGRACAGRTRGLRRARGRAGVHLHPCRRPLRSRRARTSRPPAAAPRAPVASTARPRSGAASRESCAAARRRRCPTRRDPKPKAAPSLVRVPHGPRRPPPSDAGRTPTFRPSCSACSRLQSRPRSERLV